MVEGPGLSAAPRAGPKPVSRFTKGPHNTSAGAENFSPVPAISETGNDGARHVFKAHMKNRNTEQRPKMEVQKRGAPPLVSKNPTLDAAEVDPSSVVKQLGAPPAVVTQHSSDPLGVVKQQISDPPAAVKQQTGAPPEMVKQETGAAPAVVKQHTGAPPAVVKQRTGAPPAVAKQQTGAPPAVVKQDPSLTPLGGSVQCRLAASRARLDQLEEMREKQRRLVEGILPEQQMVVNRGRRPVARHSSDVTGSVRQPNQRPSAASESVTNVLSRGASSASLNRGNHTGRDQGTPVGLDQSTHVLTQAPPPIVLKHHDNGLNQQPRSAVLSQHPTRASLSSLSSATSYTDLNRPQLSQRAPTMSVDSGLSLGTSSLSRASSSVSSASRASRRGGDLTRRRRPLMPSDGLSTEDVGAQPQQTQWMADYTVDGSARPQWVSPNVSVESSTRPQRPLWMSDDAVDVSARPQRVSSNSSVDSSTRPQRPLWMSDDAVDVSARPQWVSSNVSVDSSTRPQRPQWMSDDAVDSSARPQWVSSNTCAEVGGQPRRPQWMTSATDISTLPAHHRDFSTQPQKHHLPPPDAGVCLRRSQSMSLGGARQSQTSGHHWIAAQPSSLAGSLHELSASCSTISTVRDRSSPPVQQYRPPSARRRFRRNQKHVFCLELGTKDVLWLITH